MFAPVKTPPSVISRLDQEIVRIANRPDVKEKFFNSGVEAVASSPDELTATMKSEIEIWEKVIKDRGIRIK